MLTSFMERVRQAPTAAFFILAFAISWLIWIPLIQPLQGLMTFDVPIWAIVLLIVGATGPSVAAIIVAYCVAGGKGVRHLFADFGKWRVGARWYAAVIFIPLVLFMLAVGGYAAVTGQTPELDFSQGLSLIGTLAAAYAVRFLIALPTGPMAEEMGWRGFALPVLQRRYSALTASLIIGVAWGLWHLPMFLVPGVALSGGNTILTNPWAVVPYVLGTMSKSIIFTWAYNNTRGSLLLDVLFHAAINTTANVLMPIFYPNITMAEVAILSTIELSLTWLLAIFLVGRYGATHLSRTQERVAWELTEV